MTPEQLTEQLKKMTGTVPIHFGDGGTATISNRFAPEIRRLYERYHPQGANFYLIYVDPREQPETIGKHLREYEYPCQGLRDPEHTLHPIHLALGKVVEGVDLGIDRPEVFFDPRVRAHGDLGRWRDAGRRAWAPFLRGRWIITASRNPQNCFRVPSP